MRVAVIGAGISGLSAAYYLSRKHEVHLFEKDSRLGGHTHTVTVDSSKGPLCVDTGFIVHNQKTYPNFCRLLNELGVATAPSDMSFAVHSSAGSFEYSSRGARGFFADPRNLVRPGHWGLLREILRFNREAPRLLDMPSARDANWPDDLTLCQFMVAGRYSMAFQERYLYPMASAVWSMSPARVAVFPAMTVVRFFANHGMLGINTHPQWKVIAGGSHSYLAPITAPYRDRIYTRACIQGIKRGPESVSIFVQGLPEMTVDHVVFACHGNQVLPLLSDASPVERDILSNFTTTCNDVVLHTDDSLLPRRKSARASWNYRLGRDLEFSVTYDMNRLQSLDTAETYCVTLNAAASIDPDKIIRRMLYYHPVYNREAIRAQARWKEISGLRRTHFCGAYWGYGFHEDGVNSALRVARALDVEV